MSSLSPTYRVVRACCLRSSNLCCVRPVVCCRGHKLSEFKHYSTLFFGFGSKSSVWRSINLPMKVSYRNFSNGDNGTIDAVTYDTVSEETLESLNEYMDELLTTKNGVPDSDVTYGDGVLTVKLGKKRGTYVINKQSPNKQIWLSSPISGPKRYDFIDGRWIYKHDGVALHDLLTKEFNQFLKIETNFSKCAHG